MKIELYQNDQIFSDLCAEWGDLLADSAVGHVFLTCEWQRTWWDVYQPGEIWSLVVRDDDGRLVALAPWFRTEDDGQRIIRAIGCVDVTDYLEIILRSGVEEAALDTIAAYLAAHQDAYDQLELCNIPEDSPMLRLLPPRVEANGLRVESAVEDVCPVVTLPDKWTDYIASLDKKNRHELRRKLRRAGGNMGDVDWYIVNGGHDLQQELDKFLALMAASNEEKAEFLTDDRNREFFARMVPLMAEQGWLQLAFLTVNGEPAATYLNLDYNNRVLVYNSGHDAGAHGHLSPGIILLARLIEHAIAEDRDEFDFLRGDESYKYDMGGKDTRVYRMSIFPAAG